MLFSINARIKNKKKKTVVMIYHCHGHFKKVSGYQIRSINQEGLWSSWTKREKKKQKNWG